MIIRTIFNTKILTAALVLGACFAAQAQESETRGYLTRGSSGEPGTGWAPYFGLAGGYTAYTNHLDVEGEPNSAKIIGSYTTGNRRFVFDAGLGMENQTFAQTAAQDRNLQTAVMELAARYQWENRWQAGLVWNTLFDAGSDWGANQGDAQFVGLQGLKEFNISQEWVMRLGGRYMTDANVDGTWINQFMVDVQFGWQPSHAASMRAAEATSYAPPQKQVLPQDADTGPAPKEGYMPPSQREYLADDLWAHRDFLLFDLNSATLDASDNDRLQRLVAALKDHPGIAGKIEVLGYADPTGTEQYNQKLSGNRAEAVKDILVKNGFDPKTITVVAKGESDPIPGSLSKSRRVELHFEDVQDHDALARLVNSVQ